MTKPKFQSRRQRRNKEKAAEREARALQWLEDETRRAKEAKRELEEQEARQMTDPLPEFRNLVHYIKHKPRICKHHLFSFVNNDERIYVFGPARFQVAYGECWVTQNPDLFNSETTKGMLSLGKYVYPWVVGAPYHDSYSKVRFVQHGTVTESFPRAEWAIPVYPVEEVTKNEPRVESVEDLLALTPGQVIDFVDVHDPAEFGKNSISFFWLRYDLIRDLGKSSFQLESSNYNSGLRRYGFGSSFSCLPPTNGRVIFASEALELWDEIGDSITAAYQAIRNKKPAREVDCFVLSKETWHIDTTKMADRKVARLIHDKLVPLVTVFPWLKISGVRCYGFVPPDNIYMLDWKAFVPSEQIEMFRELPERYLSELSLDLYQTQCLPSNSLIDELNQLSALKFLPKYPGELTSELIRSVLAGEIWYSAKKRANLWEDLIFPKKLHREPGYFSLTDLALILNSGCVPNNEKEIAIQHTCYKAADLIPLLSRPIEYAVSGYLKNQRLAENPQILMIKPSANMPPIKNLSKLALEYFGLTAYIQANCDTQYIGMPLACVGEFGSSQFDYDPIPVSAIAKRVLLKLYPDGVPEVEHRGEPKEGEDLINWCRKSGIPLDAIFLVEWAQTQPFIPSFY